MTNERHGMLTRLLGALWRDERASTMTEFVIGLPIYVLIFSGMGALYRLNEEALHVRMTTVTELTADQKADHFKQFVPVTGALAATQDYGDLFQNLPSAKGMYRDSYVKTSLPHNVLDGPMGVDPVHQIEEITMYDPASGIGTFTNDLFQDKGFVIPYSASSDGGLTIPQMLMNIIDGLGVPLAIGAGIRYGAAEGHEQHTFSHPWVGTITYDPHKIDVPAPTAAHHRAAPLAIARLETWTECPWDYEILRFNVAMASCGSGGSAGEQGDAPEDNPCYQQATQWNSCAETCRDSPETLDPPLGIFQSCEGYCEPLEPDDSCQGTGGGIPSLGDFPIGEACGGQPCTMPQEP